MKTVSNIKPNDTFKIEKINNNKCEIVFFTNVKEIEQENEAGALIKQYEYDLYRLEAIYRDNLASQIENNYDVWLNHAMLQEENQVTPLSDKEKIKMLEQENKVQDEMIDITMLATDEMFSMLEPLLASVYTAGATASKMAQMYASMVQRGLKTLDEVPSRYREEVEKLLG